MINLAQVFRQKSQDFVDMLNEMRSGKLTDQTIKNFSMLRRDLTYDSGVSHNLQSSFTVYVIWQPAAVHIYPVNHK